LGAKECSKEGLFTKGGGTGGAREAIAPPILAPEGSAPPIFNNDS